MQLGFVWPYLAATGVRCHRADGRYRSFVTVMSSFLGKPHTSRENTEERSGGTHQRGLIRR